MSLFGTDGIRARAGEGPLTTGNLELLGRALGNLLRREPRIFHPEIAGDVRALLKLPHAEGLKVVIGRDTRASGPGIERDLLSGMGVQAIRVGVLSTPGIAFLARKWKASLGISISASHNPAHDNGVKIISGEGFKIPDVAEFSLEKAISDPGPARPSKSIKRGAKEYFDFLRAQLPKGRPLKGFRIVVDCGHGATSAYAKRIIASTGADARVLHAAPTGRNINAGSGALYPEKLGAAVRKAKAHLGVAYDGDADRCILVDETGTVRDGDYILAISADFMRKHGGLGRPTVVSTVMANFGLEKFLQERGLELRRVKVGDKFVADEMMRTGARLGGEQSGHIIYLDAATAGDGMLTTMRVLRILLETGAPLGDLCAGMTKMPQLLVNVPVREKPDLETIEPVRSALAEQESRLAGRGRIVLRYSGTESLCRVMAEGVDATEVRHAVHRIAEAVKRAIG